MKKDGVRIPVNQEVHSEEIQRLEERIACLEEELNELRQRNKQE